MGNLSISVQSNQPNRRRNGAMRRLKFINARRAVRGLHSRLWPGDGQPTSTSRWDLHIHISRSLTLAAVAICLHSGSAAAYTDSLATGGAPADSLEWIPHVVPNSEDETYLRYLQATGAVSRYPWGLRGFSPAESKRLAARVGAHPWSRSSAFTSVDRRARILPLVAELRANSAFPYGSNDGPVWAGRGLTASTTLGVAMSAGPVSLVLSPTAFISQNASFELLDNRQTGDRRFADGMRANFVDRPQRFGDDPYGRIDPGNSTLRADLAGLTAGVSTAAMSWGPSQLYPFILGTSAPGFAHGFFGTAQPVNVFIGSVHGRVIWGRLEQTEYSPVQGEATYVSRSEPGTRRFASGLLAMFQPRGARGLEVGVARFFHSPWPRSGIPRSYFWKPFEGILKAGLAGAPEFSDPSTSAENQVISGFARWAFPSAGFEMYAEYGRDDHSWDKRDFSQEPDHSRSYGLGLRKTLRLTAERMDGLTFEMISFQLPHLARTGRGEGSIYTHTVMRQGHTHRGQLLGADVGVGAAAGSTIRWDRYSARGRTSLSLHRTVRQQRGNFHVTGVSSPRLSDVQYALEAVGMRRLKRIEVTGGLALIRGLDRNFTQDASSVSLVLRARVPLSR